MTSRLLRLLAAIVATAVLALSSLPTATAAAAPVEPTPPSYVDNPFIPEDRNLSECISALPKPGCGSEERSDVRQLLVFLVLVGGLGLIGWRVVSGIRKHQRST